MALSAESGGVELVFGVFVCRDASWRALLASDLDWCLNDRGGVPRS